MVKKALIIVWLLVSVNLAQAQQEISFHFAHPTITNGQTLKLEGSEYLPKQWNSRVILMSHGSTGGNDSSIKTTLKFVGIGKIASDNGYIFVTYMRKGRGKSEGTFTEETRRCDSASLSIEVNEAEAQLQQVIQQVKEKYKVSKVILMGHSRGGFLSADYASKHSDEVEAVINLAGGWSTACERKSGGFGAKGLEGSARVFGPQYWAYFENDSYFASTKFGDPDYAWFKKVANENGVVFKVFTDGGRKDGHQAPTWAPAEWAADFFPRINLSGKK